MSVNVTTLSNGLRVATDTMSSVETVTLGIWVRVGSRNESPEENGLSHMLEHMAFKGTKTRSAKQIAQEIESVGGHINAYTSKEQTAYHVKVLKEDLPLAVEILCDIIQNSTFEDEELEKERMVVLQEIGQTNDTPDDIIFDYYQEKAFPNQPLGRPILGTEDTVNSFKKGNLFNYIQTKYTPEKMVFSAAGAVEHDELLKLVETHLDLSGAQTCPEVAPATYVGGEARHVKELEQVHFVLGFNGVPTLSEAFYTQSVYSAILGGGMSSRLFQEIREKRGLVYTIYAFGSSYVDCGSFAIYAGTSAKSIDELIQVVQGEIAATTEKLEDGEINRAKAQLKSGLLMSRERTSSRCEQLASQLLTFGRHIGPEELTEKVEAVNHDALTAFGSSILTSTPTVAMVGPVAKAMDYENIKSIFGK